jgi:hypothetical protein
MSKPSKPQRHEQDRRVTELENKLKERDERIKTLRRELSEAEELISDMREQIEDDSNNINSWIESFRMEQDANGKWTFAPWVDQCMAARDAHAALVTKWNRFVGEYNAVVLKGKRSVGRPLGASEAQVREVRKRLVLPLLPGTAQRYRQLGRSLSSSEVREVVHFHCGHPSASHLR